MDVPLNNFKGVMLCNRPNDNVVAYKEKYIPNLLHLGLFALEFVLPSSGDYLKRLKNSNRNLFVNFYFISVANPVLERHKKWLEEFKLQN